MIHPLLKNVDTLDFSNSQQVCEFGNLLINSANLLGWFIGTAIDSAVRSEMLKICKTFVKGVDAAFKTISATDALTVYTMYDWNYRIAFNNSPSPDFTFGIVSGALDAHIHGDKDVDIYELYRLINLGMMFHAELYKGKPLKWISVMLDSWHKDFRTGKYINHKSQSTRIVRPSEISDIDILNRVAILLKADLFAFENNTKAYKKRLFDNHRHYIDDLLNSEVSYDVPTLMALGNFINASWNPFITQDEHDTYCEAVLSEMSAKTDSPYLKASIEIRLKADK